MTLLFFLVPVIAWLVFAKFWLHHHFTAKELAAQSVLTISVLAALLIVSDMAVMGDTKIVNGEVTEKEPRKRSCPIGWVSYPDSHCTHYFTRTVKVGESCSTDTKGNRSCTDITETQYNYIYAWERRYFVHSDVPETFEIDRTDPQGVRTPDRFASVNLGDPVAVERYFTNYIRGASSTLLRDDVTEPADVSYPRVYDHYRADRVIYAGVSEDPGFVAAWNASLAEVNRDLRGAGANAIVILTAEPAAYAQRVARAWEAHNINDIVVVIGVDPADPRSVRWADTRSWSSQSLVNVLITDRILALGRVDPEAINLAILESARGSFRPREMSEFEYLKDDIPLPWITIVLALLTIFVFTPLITLYFARHVDWR